VTIVDLVTFPVGSIKLPVAASTNDGMRSIRPAHREPA